jgi:transposase
MRCVRDPTPAQLTAPDRRRLLHAIRRERDARVCRRAQAVLLVDEGHPVDEILRLTGLSRSAIYRWQQRYLATRRIDALRDQPRQGRPTAADAITNARIARELRRDPRTLGYVTTGWTVVLLATHLSRTYGCPITPRTLRRRLHDLGVRWKRPRYVYAEKDAHRAQKKGALFAA